MKLDVAFTPAEMKSPGRRVVVVIDVLRATSTIVEALVNGARAVVPVADVDDAVSRAERIGRDSVLLCGERGGEPIPGFHLGNSPLEFTRERVEGRSLIMTTTNGTRALLATGGSSACFIGALLNARAVAQRLVERGEDVVLLCAGGAGVFALDDAMCAGRIARYVRELGAELSGNDGLAAALALSRDAPTARSLAKTEGGRRLEAIGRHEDIAFCARENRYDVVPVLDEHRIRL